MFDPKLLLHICVDVSMFSVDVALKQPDTNNFLHPIGFYPRSLKCYQQNYLITELESLAG